MWTPSPRLVADSGGEGAIRPWVGLALLGAVVGGIVVVALLADRVMLFRKRGLEPAWREANEPELRDRFFDFAESFAPLYRIVPDHADVRRILTYPEWPRVAPALAGFQGLYDARFRYEEGAPLTLEGGPLVEAVREQIFEPLGSLEGKS